MITQVKHAEGGYLLNGVTYVPNNPDNRIYTKILDWINAGGVVDPKDPDPTENTRKITKLQAVIFFQENGIEGSVNALIAANPLVKARYDAAWEFAIDNPDIVVLGPAVQALTVSAENPEGKDLQTMFNEAGAY